MPIRLMSVVAVNIVFALFVYHVVLLSSIDKRQEIDVQNRVALSRIDSQQKILANLPALKRKLDGNTRNAPSGVSILSEPVLLFIGQLARATQVNLKFGAASKNIQLLGGRADVLTVFLRLLQAYPRLLITQLMFECVKKAKRCALTIQQ